MANQNIFVFVVCGGKEHIETLHFSLRYLQHFSRERILVVTDSKRNEIPVDHSDVIDVETPEHFNHHQASIYLKTGLPQFLPAGNLYCYLDTDVVAVSTEVDDIFKAYVSPITFAPDHCSMEKFSPYAVKCGCMISEEMAAELRGLIEKHDMKYAPQTPNLKQEQNRLKGLLDEMHSSLPKRILQTMKYHLSGGKYQFEKGYYFHKAKRVWFNDKNQPVMDDVDNLIANVEGESEFVFDKGRNTWLTADGRNVWSPQCAHLAEMIGAEFGTKVANSKWQHWNGGVFLFNDDSREFMQQWHDKTLHIFNVEKWRTRDQGTLIATVWQFGLDKQPTLSKKWNFIADYYNDKLTIDESNGSFSDNNGQTVYQPAFVHVYHHFGTRGWLVWDWVETVGSKF
ncbi:hypothetical protein BH09BAC1_BH09BAC1_04380 [soil metagenome]